MNTPNSEIKTARTEAEFHGIHVRHNVAHLHAFHEARNFARQLEQELQQARNELARLNGQTNFVCECGGTKVELQQAREELERLNLKWGHAERSLQDHKNVLSCVSAERDKLREEVERLNDWKVSAMRVFPDFQAIGQLLNVQLGEDVSSKIIPGIKDLQSQLSQAKEELAKEPESAAAATPKAVSSSELVVPQATRDAILMMELWDCCICQKIRVQEGSNLHELLKETLNALRHNK